MHKGFRAIFALSFSFVLMHWGPQALALDPPGEREIASALTAELPAYWSVKSVEVTSSVNEGDDVSPRYRQRFVADAIPREDLYLSLSDGKIGPFTMLITTSTAGQVRKLYGIVTSVVDLGKWSTELDLENTVMRVGMPRSLFEGPVIVAGAEETNQQLAQRFLKFHELSKTVTEGVVRSSAGGRALRKLAAEERAALEQANRQRLAALNEQYEQERALLATAAERERKQLEAANQARLAALKAKLEEESARVDEMATAAERERKQLEDANQARLAALKAKLEEESARVDEMATALAEERNLLMEENQSKLDALRAQYERKRAEVRAVAETLDAIGKAEAETEAQKKLVAALATLAEEKKRAAAAAQKARAADVVERKASYDALVAALGSKNISEQNAAFYSYFDSGDKEGKRMAIAVALASDDKELKKTAIDAAMKSGDDALQAMALAALISKSQRIAITLTGQARGRKVTRTHVFEITSFNEKALSFSGKYRPDARHSKVASDNGGGSIQRDRLSLTGQWQYRNDGYGCNIAVEANDKGSLSGFASCHSDSRRDAYNARVDL